MVRLAFLHAACLLVLGGIALAFRTTQPGAGEFAYSAVFFGGGILICALFSLNMRRHGLSAAAFMAFLAFLTGCGRIFTRITSPPDPDPALLIPILTAVFTLLSLAYLAASVRHWQRSRRMFSPDATSK